MRTPYKTDKTPTGARRVVRRFLWWPLRLPDRGDGEVRWLESADIAQEYGPFHDDGVGGALLGWKDVAFADRPPPPPTPLRLAYTNHRGETRVRVATPLAVRFGTSEWHPEPQWLLEVFDEEKGEPRTFAFSGLVRGE